MKFEFIYLLKRYGKSQKCTEHDVFFSLKAYKVAKNAKMQAEYFKNLRILNAKYNEYFDNDFQSMYCFIDYLHFFLV